MNKIITQPIKNEEVTKVVENFRIFCEYIRSNPVLLTTTLLEIGKKDCFEIDRLLQYPRQFDAPKYLMTSYPTIAMYFQIIHNLGIFKRKKHRKGEYKGKNQLIPTDLYNQFFQMPDLKQYIVLFWGFWVNSSFEYLYKDTLGYFDVEETITEGFELIKDAKPNQKISIDFNPDKPFAQNKLPIYYWFTAQGTSIHHFRDFGFWEYEEAFSTKFYASTREIRVQSITPTRLGIEMMRCCRMLPLPLCNRYYKESPLSDRVTLLKPLDQYATGFVEAFHPLFPGFIPLSLDNPSTIREKQPIKNTKHNPVGTVSIKVSLGKSFRVIKITFHHTLEDLHLAIQNAFEFNNDHLYAFHMDGDIRSRYNVYWGDNDEPPFASDTLIHQINWRVGQNFIYHFDFGDDWIFRCQVMEINLQEQLDGKPKIIQSNGNPPQQYPLEYKEEDRSNIAKA